MMESHPPTTQEERSPSTAAPAVPWPTDAQIDAVCAPGRAARWKNDGRQYDRDTVRLALRALLPAGIGLPEGAQGTTVMDLKQLGERCSEHTARINSIILLAAAVVDDELSPPLSELVEDYPDVLNRCFKDFPLDRVESALDKGDSEEARGVFVHWSITNGKTGFLLEMSTPVMTHRGGTVSTYCWGYSISRWVYGSTFDQALERGFAWVAEQRAAEAAEAQEA